MEWNAFNIILSLIFVTIENAGYINLRKPQSKRGTVILTVIMTVEYAAMFVFLLINGATIKQTMLLILATLPAAFIPLKEGKKK